MCTSGQFPAWLLFSDQWKFHSVPVFWCLRKVEGLAESQRMAQLRALKFRSFWLNVASECYIRTPCLQFAPLGDELSVQNLVNVKEKDKHALGHIPDLMCCLQAWQLWTLQKKTGRSYNQQ